MMRLRVSSPFDPAGRPSGDPLLDTAHRLPSVSGRVALTYAPLPPQTNEPINRLIHYRVMRKGTAEMSELLDSSPARAERLPTADGPERETPPSSPVKVWALVGAAVLCLEVYVWIRWISGPYFTHVASGPTDPPTLMKVFLTIQSV